jgi:alpha-tubulin suppressor-like RCC1 family protein
VTITWDDVRPYVVTRPQYVGNTYQLQLRSEENGDVRVTFRYGVIQWTYGEKNCGTPCRAVQASHAQIGVVSGDGRDVQVLSGSGNESILRTLNSPYTLFIRDGRIGGFGLLPSERATYTASMTATATRTATVTPTHTPTHTATHTLVSSATHTVTNTTTSTFTNTVTNTPTPTATHTTTSTFTNTVTNTPTPTATHTATTTQVWTVTHTPTASTTSTPIAQGISDGLLLWAPLNGIRTTGSTLPVQANTIMGPVQYFDGVDDYHQMSANIANKSFTVAVWAKYESDASLSRGIVSIGSTIANNAVFYLGFRNTGQYICNFYEATLSYTEYTPPPQFDRSQWHHYACTFDNVTKNRSLYIDGTLVAVQNVPLGFVGDSDVYIGVTYKQSPGHAVYYKGGVRDLFIYDRVLSASELTRIQAITPNSVMLSEPHPASACRWVDKGGMVHEYEINQDLLTWDQAKAAAESRTRGGQKGYLATIMSAAENECLVQLVETQLGWTSGATGDGPWLGAKRVSPGGTFIWQGGPEKGAQLKSSVSGAPVSYDNWNTGEPNNATGIENALQIWYSDNTAWNDDGSEDLYKSIIEYTYPESHAISGVAYTDTNANNQLDSGDFLASNQTITLTADLAQPIDLVGGGNQFCARLDDGRATCWGRRGDAWRWDQQSAVPIEIDGWRDVRAISNGINTSCALLGNGTVSCLGKNSTGAVGDGTTTDRWMPVAVSGLSNVVALNSGAGYHHCAVLANTTVKCWGANESAQLGDGTYTRRTVPATVTGLSGATQVSVGERHTCARKSDGIVWCWGSNDVGQLADGGILESTTPRQIAGVSGVTALASGPQHVCVLRSDAQVACWGHPTGINGNRSGAVVTTPTVIANTTGSVSLSVGNEQSCVAKSDGTVWCWGHVFHGEAGWVASGTTTTRRSSAAQITSVSDIVQVALSANSGCGRRANGDMLCWGEANVGQLGDGTYQPRGIATNVRVTWQTNPYAARVAMLDGSWYYQCGILTDRRVACWGLEGYYRPANHYIKPEPEIVDGLRDIVDLYVNYYFSCALQRTGLVWCWGYNLPTTIMEDGTIAGSTVERSVPRRINTVTDVIALSKGRGQTCLAIRADWSAYCVSSTTVSPEWDTFKLVPGSMTNTGWVGAVVTSYIHACALAQLNGSVWCWGNNSYFAQYGNGVANTTNNVPVQVSGLSTIQQLSVASYSTCALATTGDVHCWGNAQEIGTDGSGQVSAGQGNAYSVPKMISGITNAKKLDIGDAKQCAVLQEGTVWCWGGRLYTVERSASIVPYQIPGITDAIDVSVTGYYDSGNVCVLKRGGDVLCWGIGTQGGLGNGQTTNRAIPRSINEPWQANVNQGCEWVDWQGQRHKYESLSGNWTWPQARDIVAARTWRGNNGYLATITSPEENRCVHQLFMKQETTAQWPGMLSGLYPRRWLGGSDADSEGTWKWMTGPEAGATFRIPSGLNPGYNSFQTISDACKPNCTSPTNWDYLQLMFPQGTYIQRNQWNDESGSDNEVGAIVEYTTGTGEQARSYTTTTDSQGNYSFAGLAPGVYTVQSTTHGTTSSQRVVLWPDQRDERVDFVNRSVTNGLRQTMTAQPTSTMTPTHTHTPTMTRTPVPPNVVSTVYTWNNTDNVTQRVTINQSNQIGVLVLHTADGRDYRIGIATFNGVNYTRPVGMPQANSTDRGQNYDLVYWNLSSLSAGTYDLYYDVTTGSPTGGGGFEFFVIQGVDPVNPVQTSAGYTSSSGGIPSINLITTRMNSLLFDFFFTASSSSTAGTGQTQLYQLGGSTYGGRAGVSYKIAAAIGTHNMTQSTSSGNHSYFAMAVNPQP